MSDTDAVVFYIDNDLDAPSFVDPLREASRSQNVIIERHTDHFPGTAKDHEWLPFVADKGWFAMSHDNRIYRNATQRHFVLGLDLGLFIVRGDGRTHADLAANVIRALPRVLRRARTLDKPFVASVTFPSVPGNPPRVELRYPKTSR